MSDRDLTPICTWPSCRHTAKDQCKGPIHALPAVQPKVKVKPEPAARVRAFLDARAQMTGHTDVIHSVGVSGSPLLALRVSDLEAILAALDAQPQPDTAALVKALQPLVARDEIERLEKLLARPDKIRADMREFDGDKRGHYGALEEATEELSSAAIEALPELLALARAALGAVVK